MLKFEALWAIILCRFFTVRQGNYLLHQRLSFVEQWIRLKSRHLSSYLWPAGSGIWRGHPCTYSNVVSSGVKDERKKLFELLLSSKSPVNGSGQCVGAQNGNVFSVNPHCISSGWPYDKTPLLWYKHIKSLTQKRIEKKSWKVLPPGRTEIIFLVCMTTRVQQSSLLSVLTYWISQIHQTLSK